MGSNQDKGRRRDQEGRPQDDPIMDQLKSMYDDVAQQPLPKELLDLLEKLDEAERKR